MYQPPQFKSSDPAIAAELMRAHPLASLISTDNTGLPYVSHLPLHLEGEAGAWLLLGHCARANPHWQYLAQRPAALVTFMGPHGFLSPKIYPDMQRVPSWNYLAVHCRVTARLIDDAPGKDALLKKLIADHEPAYAAQWRGLGEVYQNQMLGNIVAFELTVNDLQCTIKLNQHRPQSHAAMKAGYAAGNAQEQALAQWMERLGLGTGEP
jgi:transcriptional regulator